MVESSMLFSDQASTSGVAVRKRVEHRDKLLSGQRDRRVLSWPKRGSFMEFWRYCPTANGRMNGYITLEIEASTLYARFCRNVLDTTLRGTLISVQPSGLPRSGITPTAPLVVPAPAHPNPRSQHPPSSAPSPPSWRRPSPSHSSSAAQSPPGSPTQSA